MTVLSPAVWGAGVVCHDGMPGLRFPGTALSGSLRRFLLVRSVRVGQ